MDDERAGVRKAATEFGFCALVSKEFNRSSGVAYGMRSCLEEVHDDFANDITKTVWRALKVGG